MISPLHALFADPFPSSLEREERDAPLLPILKGLTEDHATRCPAYRHIIETGFPDYAQAETLEHLPYLPVSLFKHRALHSVTPEEIKLTVRSSGTTGQKKSAVAMDRSTAQLSARSLASIFQSLLTPERRPMLILDAPSALRSAEGMSARAAAILGLMPFGFDHTFVLRDDFSVDEDKLTAFLEKYKGRDLLIYGFTFLVWQAFLPFCEKRKPDLSRAVLFHSGGWKHLIDQKIDRHTFEERVKKATGLPSLINFYGMAEMPGVIFPEVGDGLLLPPSFAATLIRDPLTLRPAQEGEVGLIQILTPIPQSFPGHSLLTEDLGVRVKTPRGPALRVLGRAPRTALRGCSDVLARR